MVGAPSRIRTYDLQLRRLSLYPSELWALEEGTRIVLRTGGGNGIIPRGIRRAGAAVDGAEGQPVELQDNKVLVRRFIDEAQNKGNFGVIDELCADDFVDHSPLPGLPPTREGIRILFGLLRAAFPDLRVVISEQIAEDERVVTRKTFVGTHGGEFLGLPPTGNHVEFEVVDSSARPCRRYAGRVGTPGPGS